MSSDHAVLSPSGAHRWVKCPASVQATSYLRAAGQIPEEKSSSYAKEGTLAHEIAADTLMLGGRVETDKFKGQNLEAIQEYVDYARWLSEDEDGSTTFIEQRVAIPSVDEDCFGTVDYAVLSDVRLHVVDLKFGKGIPVNAIENEQMMLYASGLLDDDLLFPERPPDNYEVVLHIFMPRIPNSRYPAHYDRVWHTTAQVIRAFAKKAKDASRHVSTRTDEMPKGPYGPDDKVCQWCPAEPLCEARKESLLDDFDDLDAPPPIITDEQLQSIFLKRKAIANFLTKVENHIVECFGESVESERFPLLKIARGRSTGAWADEDEVVRAFEEVGEDPYEQKLKGITEARKVIKPKKKVDDMITYTPGALKLMEK